MTTVLLNKNAAHLHSMLQQTSHQKHTRSHTRFPTTERTTRTGGASKV
ncbi:uncharacterized protein G2W53_010191 [Senna tora]|uniref:Uncharacterized protein n=1 Tax=Senna tora TaxID=362788 RepID=A0A834X0H9_9FABA|nr:uncharacterized protein G2W53_010191 [Senna tora]